MRPLSSRTARSRTGYRTTTAALLASVALLSGAGMAWGGQPSQADQSGQAANAYNIVPEPVTLQPKSGHYSITPATTIYTSAGDATGVGTQLATELHASTGFPLNVRPVSQRHGNTGIALELANVGTKLGTDGYQLDVAAGGVTVRANATAGLFDGVQTLRQLLPAASAATTRQQHVQWTVPDVHVVDYPRFAYRGAMLDVARHFFPVADVERYIDEISQYKVNYLHLHLTDDQGWRIAINNWSNLTTYGGSTEVGGGKGGYYTQDQYKQIVAYAAAHYITIVPEVDGPGHTNAALASYAQLNCDGKAPPLYTGTDVGFSSFCVSLPGTYTFLQDVLSQLSSVTPGPYLHVGGDEAQSTTAAQYATFEGKELPIVQNLKKSPIAWQPGIAAVNPPTSTVLEFWDTTTSDPGTTAATARGNKVIMAPANKAYLDQKYTPQTKLGQNWAAYIEEKDAYDWDPGNYLSGVKESSVLGVEAPLWSETLVTMQNIEYMAFPRLPAIAELGWSPESTHNWNSFRTRLGAQGPRWTAMGMNFYASPQIPWAPGTKGGTD